MKRTIIICIVLFATVTILSGITGDTEGQSTYKTENTDSLPEMTPKFHAFLIESKLRHEALLKFA